MLKIVQIEKKLTHHLLIHFLHLCCKYKCKQKISHPWTIPSLNYSYIYPMNKSTIPTFFFLTFFFLSSNAIQKFQFFYRSLPLFSSLSFSFNPSSTHPLQECNNLFPPSPIIELRHSFFFPFVRSPLRRWEYKIMKGNTVG